MRRWGRADQATNRGATAWIDQGNGGSWGLKLQNVFEFVVPQSTNLKVNVGLGFQAGGLPHLNLARLTPK